jgi:cytochrome c oxidase subunit 4
MANNSVEQLGQDLLARNKQGPSDVESHHANHGEHHVVPIALYLKVFAALMFLLFLTVGAAFIPASILEIWGPLNVMIAMTIAIIKAVLIFWFFMHLKWGNKVIWLFAGSGFMWLVIMFMLTYADYLTRTWGQTPGP